MSTTTTERVRKRRAALRAAGLRPVQIWVPDSRVAGFADECRRQSRLIHSDRLESDTLDWLAEAADREDWQ